MTGVSGKAKKGKAEKTERSPSGRKKRKGSSVQEKSKSADFDILDVADMSKEELVSWLMNLRWWENDGDPICPSCGSFNCSKPGPRAKRMLFRCREKECRKQFSLTSGTVMHSRKVSLRRWIGHMLFLLAGQKGRAALEVRRELKGHYKCIWIRLHKMRETLGLGMFDEAATGEVQIDGKKLSGFPRKENMASDRKDNRTKANQSSKKKNVTVILEVGGKTRTVVTDSEWSSVPWARAAIAIGATVVADGGTGWDRLSFDNEMKRVNHKEGFDINGVNTNRAEGYFSTVQRMIVGHHHHIGAAYAQIYVSECAIKLDDNELSMREKAEKLLSACLRNPPSLNWTGYFQRYRKGRPPVGQKIFETLQQRFIDTFGMERWEAEVRNAARDINPHIAPA